MFARLQKYALALGGYELAYCFLIYHLLCFLYIGTFVDESISGLNSFCLALPPLSSLFSSFLTVVNGSK